MTIVDSQLFCADGFTVRAGVSFLVAFLFVAVGVLIYSISGEAVYRPEDESSISITSSKSEQDSESRNPSNDSCEMTDIESRSLLPLRQVTHCKRLERNMMSCLSQIAIVSCRLRSIFSTVLIVYSLYV